MWNLMLPRGFPEPRASPTEGGGGRVLTKASTSSFSSFRLKWLCDRFGGRTLPPPLFKDGYTTQILYSFPPFLAQLTLEGISFSGECLALPGVAPTANVTGAGVNFNPDKISECPGAEVELKSIAEAEYPALALGDTCEVGGVRGGRMSRPGLSFW